MDMERGRKAIDAARAPPARSRSRGAEITGRISNEPFSEERRVRKSEPGMIGSVPARARRLFQCQDRRRRRSRARDDNATAIADPIEGSYRLNSLRGCVRS